MSWFHMYALPALVGAVILWVIAVFWYGVGFRKRWTVLVGHTSGAKPGRVAFEMIMAFILSFILAIVLANVIAGMGHLLGGNVMSFRIGASIAVMCWFGFIAPPMLTQSLFERRSANLFAINAGYWIVSMAVTGGVLALMTK